MIASKKTFFFYSINVPEEHHDLDATAAAIQRWTCLHTPPTGARDVAYVVMGCGMLDNQIGCICNVLVVSTLFCSA